MCPGSCTILPTWRDSLRACTSWTAWGTDHAARGRGPHAHRAARRLGLLRATAPTEPLGEVAEPAVAVIAQGVKETAVDGRAFTYGRRPVPRSSRSSSRSTGRIARASGTEPLLACVLSLRPEKIAALLSETTPRGRPAAAGRPHRRPPGIAVSDASPALLDAITRLLGLLDAPGDAAVLARRHRARGPVAAAHRPAGGPCPADRPGRQPPRPPGPRRSPGSAATTTRRCGSRTSPRWRR